MSETAACPLCGQPVHNSSRGWTVHTEGAQHMLAAMGLTPEQAEEVIEACYRAGVSFDAAMAAVRAAMARPPEFYREASEALIRFADEAMVANVVASPPESMPPTHE